LKAKSKPQNAIIAPMKERKIDFVMIWVDGADGKWLEKKNKFLPKDQQIDTRDNRYRDWENLKFWFRGVEKYAPWVNRVYFVTDDQRPAWLNYDYEKLVYVSHKDFIPEQYLPTFSSHPIELNLHRIKGLGEQFVYFNDDMFLTNLVRPEDFFRHGLPRDYAAETRIIGTEKLFSNIILNNMILLNERYGRRDFIKKNWRKFLSPRYPRGMKNNFLGLITNAKRRNFLGFRDYHFPAAFLKSSFERLWQEASEWLDETSRSKFRTANDVNQYVVRYFQYVNGLYSPKNVFKGAALFQLDENSGEKVAQAAQAIVSKKYKMICINDGFARDFEAAKDAINRAFETALPGKSKFEI